MDKLTRGLNACKLHMNAAIKLLQADGGGDHQCNSVGKYFDGTVGDLVLLAHRPSRKYCVGHAAASSKSSLGFRIRVSDRASL